MADFSKINSAFPSEVSKTNLRSGETQAQKGALKEEFRKTLAESLASQVSKSTPGADGLKELKFSNHAVERMQSRGITLEGDLIQKMESAVQKAELKGAKETLILDGKSAFIVNIPNRTVVTAMDQAQLKENIFTNIDSTVVL